MRFRSTAAAVMLLGALALPSQGQGISQWGENIDLLLVNPGFPWDADSIFLGATFLRDTTKSFVVWLDTNMAGWTGSLYLMIPGGANNGGDTALFLFKNKNNGANPTRIDLTNHPLVTANIHHLDTIYFRYKAGPSASIQHLGYTGPNRDGSNPSWTMVDRYYAVGNSPQVLYSPDGSPFVIGRRWCAAGWILDPATNQRTDTVHFAFEDDQAGGTTDYDFNDILFKVTGIFLIKPSVVQEIRLDAYPDRDTIQAGDSVWYRATVIVDSVDSFGVHHIVADSGARADRVTWRIMDPVTGGTLVNGEGPTRSNTFTATIAWRSYRIIASIVDGMQIVSETLSVYVIPDDPYRLYAENAYDTAQGLNKNTPNPISTLTMPSSVLRDSVYAVIRDRFGNWTGPSTNTTWGVIPDTTIVTAKSTSRTSIGEGVIAQKGPPGTAQVWALNQSAPTNALMRDTFTVVVDPATYTALRFVVGTGGQKSVINTMSIGLGNDTLIYAEGHRADGIGGDNLDGWVSLNVSWTRLSSNITSSNPPPGSASQWLFAPTGTPGTGADTISSGSLRAVLAITVLAGPPARMVLYSSTGNPATLTPYQSISYTYPWAAGVGYQFVAKVFDAYGNWLQSYENAGAPVAWQVRNVTSGLVVDTSIATMTPTAGAISSFGPRQAYVTLDVIGTFTLGSSIFKDTVRAAIRPGQATHLSIEGSIDTTRGNRELSLLDFTGSDTLRQVYAVLRDMYYNFVARADSAQWLSRDTAVVTAAAGTPRSTGNVRRRTTATSQTYVLASQGTLVDSVRVTVTDFTYTQVRIVVNAGGFRDIDTLRQRTDQDTTLYAQGLSYSGQWVPITVTWSLNSLLGVTPPATEVDRWALRPTVADTGWIKIRKGNAVDSVRTFFLLGLPSSVVLYSRDGAPGQGGNNPYPTPPATDTLVAGNDTALVALVFDQYGSWLSSYRVSTSVIRWSLTELSGTGPTGTFSTATGYSTVFTPTRAGNLVEVVATFSEGGRTFADAARFYVKPAAATHLVIEESPYRAASPYQDNPLASIVISSGDTVAYAYAVLRDQFGNFVTASPATAWLSRDAAVVEARGGTASLGEGIVTRQALSGTTNVLATDLANSAFRDSVPVVLSQVVYDSLQIVINNNGLRRIDTLRLRTDQDTTLYAIGKRSDNGQWDAVRVRWTSVGVTATSSAPVSADQWSIRPADTDTGFIYIAGTGPGGVTIRDTVRALFMPGPANRLTLFPDSSAPNVGANSPYASVPATYTLTAGDTLPLAAMVFDHRDVWLTAYKSLTAPISWTIAGALGSDTTGRLTRSSGYFTRYTATRAYHTVDLIAEFSASGITLRDTVRVTVVPGPATHLVLEGSPDRTISPNTDNPMYAITLGSRDTVYDEIYAITRDQYGNWVGYSKTTGWISLDTSVATAQEGIAEIGQGWIRRGAVPGDTRVAAWSLSNPGFTDTIDVTVSNITYDGLRIVVNAGGMRDIDTLRMRTDQDTTLYALGLRSDNGQWDNLRVRWGSTGLSVSPGAPASSDQWAFQPLSATSGVISASAENGAITDQVVVIFSVGLPHHVVLYPAAGTPDVGTNLAYPAPTVLDTIVAGTATRLVAKIYDHNDVWLSGYERASSPISWTLVERSGNPPTGNLTPRAGYLSDLMPQHAYNTVYIVAQFDSGGIAFADTVYWYVKPGAPTHVVLEARPNPMASPNDDNPAGVVTISSRDTVANVYAVLRDEFGNYVGFSQSTGWLSLDATLVTAGNGVPSIGEGRIIRQTGGGGQTSVIATSLDYPGFKDTVTVVLSTISYDSLRIVTGESTRINNLTLGSDQDTTLLVQGKRSDNGLWESVPATWEVSTGLRMQPNPPTSASSWTFAPADTGRGWIRVTLGNDQTTIPDSVSVRFVPGPAARMVLYPLSGAPFAGNQPYPDPISSMSLTAGSSIRAVAKLLDALGIWLGDTVVSWRVEELVGAPPTGSLSDTLGRATTYTVDRAFNSVYVVARYTEGSRVLLDTLYLSVTAGPADHVVIEGSQNWQVSPYDDNPLDSITLTTIETYRSVYLVVRDSLGNFVSFSQRTGWESLDTTIATITDGISSVGEGVVKNQRPDVEDTLTQIIAESREYSGLRDTLQVRVVKIYFTDLRIVVGDSTPIESLNMSTNDDTTLHVQGRRSDNGRWIDVQAYWLTSPGMAVDPAAPGFGQSWTFSPSAPDTGWIVVTLNSDSTTPDTVPTFFRRGDPTRVEFEILTPPADRRAGDTLVAVVRVRNDDGLLPGTYCDSTIYQELFGTGGAGSPPVVIADGADGEINQRPDSTSRMDECFADGIDTVRFVLYYAPYDDDSLNQLFVRVGGIEASTVPFTLLPADLNSIVLENDAGADVGDSIVLRSPDGSLFVYAMGYDRFGNRIGPVPSNWSVVPGGTLHEVSATRATRLYYSAAGVQYDESGCIEVRASADPSITERVCIAIIAPPARLVSSVSRDVNGDGYLDRIEVKFSKFVSFPEDYAWSVDIHAGYGTTQFQIDSVSQLGVRDTVFTVYLAQVSTRDPQTSWTPWIILRNVDAADTLVEDTAADGAGPVIWRVVVETSGFGLFEVDTVTVTFSEPIDNIDVTVLPASVFNVWRRGADGSWVLVEGFLDSIGMGSSLGFLNAPSSNSVKFVMSNRNALSADYYLNIVVDTTGGVRSSEVVDVVGDGNSPVFDNRRVKVYVQPAPPPPMQAGPNPASTSSVHTPLSIEYAPEWVPRVAAGDGGVVLSVPFIKVPGSEDDIVNGDMRIYDLAGNLVAWDKMDDMLQSVRESADGDKLLGGNFLYFVYWGGTNDRGMRVAAGIYRAVLRLSYPDNPVRNKVHVSVVGIRR